MQQLNALQLDITYFTIFDFAGITAQRNMRLACKNWRVLAEKASKMWLNIYSHTVSLPFVQTLEEKTCFQNMQLIQLQIDTNFILVSQDEKYTAWKKVREHDQTVLKSAQLAIYLSQVVWDQSTLSDSKNTVKFLNSSDSNGLVNTVFPILVGLSHLQCLNLSGKDLGQIPNLLSRLTNLTSLNLSKNHLRDLPLSLSTLTKLDQIYLDNNHFSEIPDVIFRLPQLSLIDLTSNCLFWISKEIGRMQFLHTLLLRDNQIFVLPQEIIRLPLLKTFNCRENYLRGIPYGLQNALTLKDSRSWHVKKELNKLRSPLESLEERVVISCEGTT